jgi:hypothetical protein
MSSSNDSLVIAIKLKLKYEIPAAVMLLLLYVIQKNNLSKLQIFGSSVTVQYFSTLN